MCGVPRAPSNGRERRFRPVHSHYDRIVLRNDVIHCFLSLVFLIAPGCPERLHVSLLAVAMRLLRELVTKPR
ncbi:hypothetical protein GCM10025762_40710 [Haloechinothrix salitolerans]